MKKTTENNEISFLGRVFYFVKDIYAKMKAFRLFGRISDRQKRLAGYAGNAPTTESRIAYILGVAKVTFITLFVTLTVAILLFAGRIISYENVYYMFKDIEYISSYGESRPEALNYSKPLNNQYFTSFKKGLAVASDSELKFFTATGRITISEGLKYTNPKIAASNSQALVYDSGRKSFAIYNSFISLYSETLEYPISYASVADNGSFVVVTKSKKYSSVIRMYDNDFSLFREYFKNDYVISAELSDNGKYLAVTSLDAKDGEAIVTLNVLKMKTGEIISSTNITGDMPYGCKFASENKIILICREKALVLDINGKMRAECEYQSSISDYHISGESFALVFVGDGIDKANTVAVYDADGKNRLTRNVDGRVIDVALSDNYLYVLLDREVLRIDVRYGTVSRASSFEGATELVVLADEVAVCTEAAAYYLTFK